MESDLHRSVGDTHRLIAHARRLRSEYLRASLRQLVSWVVRRWSRKRLADERVENQDAGKTPDRQSMSPADSLRRAA